MQPRIGIGNGGSTPSFWHEGCADGEGGVAAVGLQARDKGIKGPQQCNWQGTSPCPFPPVSSSAAPIVPQLCAERGPVVM